MRVNHGNFTFDNVIIEDAHFSAQFYWINSRKRIMPLLKLKSFDNGESDIFFSFPSTWTGKVSEQNLHSGYVMSSDVTGQKNTVLVAKDGLIQIAVEIGIKYSGAKPVQVRLRWNGRGFWPATPQEVELMRRFTLFRKET